MARKPNGCTYPDCFNCLLEDCVRDTDVGKEAVNAYARRYYSAHKEKISKKKLDYYHKSKDKVLEKRHTPEYREYKKLYMREYRRKKLLEDAQGLKASS